MTLNHAILFSLLLASASFCFQVHAAAFLSQETSTGIVDLQKDSQGFFVKAGLAYFSMGPRPKRDPPLDSAVKMMVSLSNSETLATSNCLNFQNYDYLDYNWASYNNWDLTISYLNFIASSSAGYTYIYIDRKDSRTDTKVFLTNKCQTGAYGSVIGFDRYGVIGLGNDQKRGNPWLWKSFSVFIEPDLSAGKLIFTGDISNYTKSSGPAYKLSADSDWRSFIASGSVGVKDYSAAFKNLNVVFDINSDAIGLPYDLFTLFTTYFVRFLGVTCNFDQIYRPSCKTTGSVEDLPDITLSLNNIKIRIPSKIYASSESSSSFKLNLKAISPSLYSLSYVTPAFQDSIILDARFMSYYFTVFDATSGSNVISLYPTVVEKESEYPNWFQPVVNWFI